MENEDNVSALNGRLPEGDIIFFDGVCVLCSRFVNFVMKRDKTGRYRYATLQSEPGQQVQRALGLPPGELQTFVLVERGAGYTKSTAALRVIRNLSGLWPLIYACILVPRPLRDALYNYVGQRRYLWFGRTPACRLPTEEERGLFLD